MGFILILFMIVLNFILALTCMGNNSCEILDTYNWGFMNALVIMLGLMMLGD